MFADPDTDGGGPFGGTTPNWSTQVVSPSGHAQEADAPPPMGRSRRASPPPDDPEAEPRGGEAEGGARRGWGGVECERGGRGGGDLAVLALAGVAADPQPLNSKPLTLNFEP